MGMLFFPRSRFYPPSYCALLLLGGGFPPSLATLTFRHWCG